MIGILTGTIHNKQPGMITLLTSGGVGYIVKMSPLMAAGCHVGETHTLFTYLKVSDTAMEIYGFETQVERSFFELLLTVKGVGPKSALNILALGSIAQIQSAIARGDATYLSAVQGMGKKTAERLCVELKNKVSVGEETKSLSAEEAIVVGEVIDGLVALGYSKEEAKAKVQEMDANGMSTEALLKKALQS